MDEELGNISEVLFDANGSWGKEVRSVIGQSLDSLDRKEFWAILRICMESSPVRQADVFAMRTIDVRPDEDICKEMKITPSNLMGDSSPSAIAVIQLHEAALV